MNMQQPTQQKLMSLKEIYINRGRQEGRQEGEEIKAAKVAKLMLLKHPHWSNGSIAEITGLTVVAIEKLREKLAVPEDGAPKGKISKEKN